jgi:hypothetical protein
MARLNDSSASEDKRASRPSREGDGPTVFAHACKRGQYLGTVDAPNEKAAEAAAVAEFDLSDEQRRQLVVRERN